MKGEVEPLNFVEHYFFLVQIIYSDTHYVDWAYEVSEHLSRTLSAMKFYNTFHIFSFLVYMLASLQFWLGLLRLENFPNDVKFYEFYPCLQLQNNYVEYVRVNDAFTMRICRELQGCLERSILKVMVAISQFGNYFIEFLNFFYFNLATFDKFPLKLPRYPNDMIMLIEILR